MEFFEPPLRITMPPPLSPRFFSCPPPKRRSFSGVTPPFKRGFITIKPDVHIFCSVQYDLYFLFNVKLLTTHSTDVAATSVNSKNKFCPFAKALLHYFNYFSNIKKQGEEFAHDFNVKQIKCVEAKAQKVTRDTETLEERKDSFRSIFKGLHRDRISKGRRKKENRRKSNARKKKRFENNVQRVYSICVGNPLGNDLPKCLLYPPCLAVPEGCIDVQKVSELLLIEMRHTLYSSCKENISATTQEAELSQTSSRRLEITCTASCTLKSML